MANHNGRQGAERPPSRCSHGGPPPAGASFRVPGRPLQCVGDEKLLSSSAPP